MEGGYSSDSSDEGGGGGHGMKRRLPNVLVTGTPGCGKSATVAEAAAQCGAATLVVGEVVAAQGFFSERDQWGAALIEEDPLLDWMEEQLAAGGVLVEHHGSSLFPERWFDAVVVLTTDNTILWDRLAARGYPDPKIQQNVQCEIMQVVLEEARDSYAQHIIHVRPSDTSDQLQDNAAFIAQLYQRLAAEMVH